MKKIISAFTIAAVFAACNSNPKMGDQSNRTLTYSDTLYNHTPLTDKPQAIEAEPINNVAAEKETVVKYVYVTAPKATKKAPVRTTTRRSTTSSSTGSGTVAQTPVPAKKKGWSKAAKGTAIGGVGGAVLGAVISKNKTKGAIIGGVIGAAGGYAIGRGKDKKDGRY